MIPFTLSGCNSNSKGSHYPDEEVRFDSIPGEVTLAGTLSLPPGEGPYPGVVLVSGSGPNDRDETIFNLRPFKVLSDLLNGRGYAVLRYDDRGVGESTGDFSQATVDDHATDASAAMQHMAADIRIRSQCLVLIGHSEGGYVGPIAAASHPPAAMVLLAGPAQTSYETFLDQQINLVFPDEDPAEVAALLSAINDIVRWSDNLDEAGRLIDALLIEADFDEEMRQEYVLLFASPLWKRYLDHEPARWLQGLDLPVLALYGEKDQQVRAEANAPLMVSYLMNSGSRVEVLPGLNHLFQVAVTGMPDEYLTLPGEVFDTSMHAPLLDWLEIALPSDCHG
jgi:pimeloyl-ACP methyl ester carboxylesterase